MKSRISSFRIGKELWKKQIWLFALACLMYFVLCTISGTITINMMAQNAKVTLAGMQKNFVELLVPGPDSYGPSVVLSLFVLTTVFVGTAAGINGFVYLHNKKRVDFIHGMPLSRTRFYLIQAGICLVDYLVPAVVFINLLLLIGSLRGIATPQAFAAGWKMIIAGFAPLLASYTMACLAMLLTGRLIVGALGVWTFVNIGPVLAMLKEVWCSTFLKTYYTPGTYPDQFFWKYSPYVYPWNAVLNMKWQAIGLSLLAGLILFGINLLIYKRRPSEAAGKSMAFLLPAIVIHVILTVISSLLIGLFFGLLFDTLSKGWFVFGLIFGGLLAYVVIQMIYTPSFKEVFSGKWRLVASALIVIFIAVISFFDLTGYEHRLPDRSSIRDISLECQGQGFDTPYWDEKEIGMKIPCDENTYAFLETLSKEHVEPDTTDPLKEYITFHIRMNTKNGRQITRQYVLEGDRIRKELASLYSYDSFKEGLYPSLNGDPDLLESLDLRMGDMSYAVYGDREKEKRKQLFRAIKKDVMAMTPETVSQEAPIAIIECAVSVAESDRTMGGPENISNTILIYPSFTETMAILNKDKKELSAYPDHIREINIYDMGKEDENGNYKLIESCKDQKEIRGMMEEIIPAERATIWVGIDHGKSVEVITSDDYYIESRFLTDGR